MIVTPTPVLLIDFHQSIFINTSCRDLITYSIRVYNRKNICYWHQLLSWHKLYIFIRIMYFHYILTFTCIIIIWITQYANLFTYIHIQHIHIHTPKKMKVSGLHAFVAGTFDLTGFRAAMAAWSGVRFLGESFQLGRVVDLRWQ